MRRDPTPYWSSIKERKAWAKIREQQVVELEEIRTKLYDAFDKADEYLIDQIRTEVHEITSRGCKPAEATDVKMRGQKKSSYERDPFD